MVIENIPRIAQLLLEVWPVRLTENNIFSVLINSYITLGCQKWQELIPSQHFICRQGTEKTLKSLTQLITEYRRYDQIVIRTYLLLLTKTNKQPDVQTILNEINARLNKQIGFGSVGFFQVGCNDTFGRGASAWALVSEGTSRPFPK